MPLKDYRNGPIGVGNTTADYPGGPTSRRRPGNYVQSPTGDWYDPQRYPNGLVTGPTADYAGGSGDFDERSGTYLRGGPAKIPPPDQPTQFTGRVTPTNRDITTLTSLANAERTAQSQLYQNRRKRMPIINKRGPGFQY